MNAEKKTWLLINVLGGLAVLGSYAHGLGTHPSTRDLLWGGIPEPLRGIYGITMWLATAGYLMFLYEVGANIDPTETRIGRRSGFRIFNVCSAAVLVASALWMPTTFAYLEQPSAGLWLFIRIDLLVVGLGALGLILAFFQLSPRREGWSATVTALGLLLFALQTAFLDAFVWPAFFAAGGG